MRIRRQVGAGAAAFLCAGLFCSAVPAKSTQPGPIDCKAASDQARGAYDRLYDALRNGELQKAAVAKKDFWDIEEHSRDCSDVQKLATELRKHNLGRNDTGASDGSNAAGNGTSDGSGTGSSGGSGAGDHDGI